MSQRYDAVGISGDTLGLIRVLISAILCYNANVL
jgi:hypothetical protein